MAGYTPYPYPNYGPYYGQPVPDQLAQLRQNQFQQQPVMQPVQPMQPQPVQPQPPDNGIIWVQGEAGAKAYLVAPGNTVQLWDSEDTVIYLKSADMSGMPSMRILDYTERNTAQPQKRTVPDFDPAQYVTWDRLDEYLTERFKRPSKTTKQKEDTENG